MVHPRDWPTIRSPKGDSHLGTWLLDCYDMKKKRWLCDPGPKLGDKLREKCLSVCNRPRCKRAKRCKYAMPLALRERRHLLFKDVKVMTHELRPIFLNARIDLPVHPKSPFARKRGQPRAKPKAR